MYRSLPVVSSIFLLWWFCQTDSSRNEKSETSKVASDLRSMDTFSGHRAAGRRQRQVLPQAASLDSVPIVSTFRRVDIGDATRLVILDRRRRG